MQPLRTTVPLARESVLLLLLQFPVETNAGDVVNTYMQIRVARPSAELLVATRLLQRNIQLIRVE